MKEMNDFLLNLYTASSDDYSPAMMFPNTENGIVNSTDSHALIQIPENELCLKYGTNPKYPDAQKIVDNFETKTNLSSVKVKMEDLAKELSKARLEVDVDSIKCKECEGRGYVEFEYVDKSDETHYADGECPICGGEGHKLKDSNFARIRLELREDDNGISYDINVYNLYFHPFQIYRLFMVALVNGCEIIEIFYDKNNYGTVMSYFGNIKVLTMLRTVPKDDE